MTVIIRSWREKQDRKLKILMLALKPTQWERPAKDFPVCLQALLQLRKRLPGFQATTHIVMIGGYLDSYGSCWRFLWMCCRTPRLLITILYLCYSKRSNISCNLLALYSMFFPMFVLVLMLSDSCPQKR